MNLRRTIVFACAALAALVGAAQEAPTAPRRQELVVTNQNLALVLESRSVTLPAGRTELLWEGAPASARTETWSVVNAAEAGVRWLGLVAPMPGQGGSELEWL